MRINKYTGNPFKTYLMINPGLAQSIKSINNVPNDAAIQRSACLLLALESNPDGLKGENLGSAVMTDSGSGVRYLATGDGQPITFQFRYQDDPNNSGKIPVGTVTVELIVP